MTCCCSHLTQRLPREENTVYFCLAVIKPDPVAAAETQRVSHLVKLHRREITKKERVCG